MPTHKLPPNIDASDNPLFPPITDDPFQYVDTSASLVPFTKLNPPPLTWLWSHLIPLGSLTLLEAPASLGKSTLLLDLAARLSSGLPLPDPTTGLLPDPSIPETSGTPEPSPVLLITPDDPSHVRSHAFFSACSTRPDLLCSFTHITLDHILSGDHLTRPFQFTSTDLDILARAIETIHPTLVIIDPFTSTLDSDSPLTETQLASLLARLNTLAATHQFACILTRTTTARPAYATRLQRSIQPLLKAATAFTLTPDPLDPDHTLLVQTKSTFARPAPILRFHLTAHPQHPDLPSLVWDGLSDLSRSDLAATTHLPTATLAPTRQHILRILHQQTTSVSVSTLAEALPELSYALLRQTLHRMLKDHQVSSPFRGLYKLPDQPSSHLLPFPEPDYAPLPSHTFPPLDTPATNSSPLSPDPVTSVTFSIHHPSTQDQHSSPSPDPVTSPTCSSLPDQPTLPSSFLQPSPLSPDPVTSVTFSTLPDHQRLSSSPSLPSSSLSQPSVTSVTSPHHPTDLSLPTSASHQPSTASPLQEATTPTNPPNPSSQETVTSPELSSWYHPNSYLTTLPNPQTPVHRPSLTTHSLANICSDLPDLPTPSPVTDSPSQNQAEPQ